MRLVRRSRSFDHPDWIFELKLVGFRALSYVEKGKGELISRNGNTLASFRSLAAEIARHFKGEDGILDGEIVSLDANGYGFGWGITAVTGHRVVEHSGGWLGFKAHIARYPDDKLTVVVLANSDSTQPSLIAHEVAEFYEPSLRRKLNKYARPHLLVIDEVGYLSYDSDAADLLYEVVIRTENY